MKKFIPFILLILLMIGSFSCNLSRTVTVKDTVKSVLTSTPDFFQFYDPVLGEGKVKDYNHTILNHEVDADFEYQLIPSPYKNDEGYYILKPASASNDTSLSPEPSSGSLIRVKRELLKPIAIPQRGN